MIFGFSGPAEGALSVGYRAYVSIYVGLERSSPIRHPGCHKPGVVDKGDDVECKLERDSAFEDKRAPDMESPGKWNDQYIPR